VKESLKMSKEKLEDVHRRRADNTMSKTKKDKQ
jgi:hypothetical protein